jgi:hypothetical protein
MSLRHLPFATLRDQVSAAADTDDTEDPLHGALTDGFGLRTHQGKPRAYLAAISFLIASKPFVQGLPGSHEIAQAVGKSVLAPA